MNIRISLLVASLIFPVRILAAPPVTHQFTNGTTIEAAQMNANFQELADRIEVIDIRPAVTTNTSDIAALQAQLTSLQDQLNTLQSQKPKLLVGYSVTTFSKEQAVEHIRLNSACNADFPGSTLCSTVEMSSSTFLTPAPTSSAWLKPKFVSITNGTAGILFSDEVIGLVRPENCHYINASGKIISDSTSFGNCDFTLPAACCR
jgi:hypothetical protein